ncbi:MAG: hypothetical protein L7W43_01380 [Rubripirellula sp.]|nr:hypothetical protein [Rubripirellula sp.]
MKIEVEESRETEDRLSSKSISFQRRNSLADCDAPISSTKLKGSILAESHLPTAGI